MNYFIVVKSKFAHTLAYIIKQASKQKLNHEFEIEFKYKSKPQLEYEHVIQIEPAIKNW